MQTLSFQIFRKIFPVKKSFVLPMRSKCSTKAKKYKGSSCPLYFYHLFNDEFEVMFTYFYVPKSKGITPVPFVFDESEVRNEWVDRRFSAF
ncbi:hypothetical protein CHCC20335_4694 [Bacillus paralicheniformis]|nr:hypothetical protein CHCC20335_4694 [Bacillus paralicheniformis]